MRREKRPFSTLKLIRRITTVVYTMGEQTFFTNGNLKVTREKAPYGKIFKIRFQNVLPRHQSACCIQISWNLADWKSVKSCIAYLTKKNRLAVQLSLLLKSCPKSARASPRQCTQECSRFYPNRGRYKSIKFTIIKFCYAHFNHVISDILKIQPLEF